MNSRLVGLSHRFHLGMLPGCSKGGFQPHQFRYWLTKEEDPQREEKFVEECQVYGQAAERARQLDEYRAQV